MNKRDFNVVGNESTDNQELAKEKHLIGYAEQNLM